MEAVENKEGLTYADALALVKKEYKGDTIYRDQRLPIKLKADLGSGSFKIEKGTELEISRLVALVYEKMGIAKIILKK